MTAKHCLDQPCNITTCTDFGYHSHQHLHDTFTTTGF